MNEFSIVGLSKDKQFYVMMCLVQEEAASPVSCSEQNISPKNGIRTDHDIGSSYSKVASFTDNEKYEICQKVWRPDGDFNFPTQLIYGKKRKFISSGFNEYPWLQYSRFLDGSFCLPCVILGKRIGINSSKVDRLVTTLKGWSCAVSRFKMHSKSDIHKTSLATMQSFLNVKKNKIKSIETIQNKIIDDKITQNRMKLASLIKIALPLARRNVPFRGHRDDSKYYDKENSGNFQALINFRIDSGDTVLKEHFDTAPKNASY